MYLKTPQEIELMREGGRILALTLDALVAAVRPGMQTRELDVLARKLLKEQGAKSWFPNVDNFPGAICTSINEEIVHGVPSNRILKEGDLLKIDLGVAYKGFNTDGARSILIETPSTIIDENWGQKKKLIKVTAEALKIGIAAAQPGKTLGDVGSAIHEYVKSHKFDVVRDLIGHGIGRDVHEDPEVPNYGKPGHGPKLVPGMVIAIEPMVVMGSHAIANGPDGYSYITADKKPAAHMEHTVAITEHGPEILTSSS